MNRETCIFNYTKKCTDCGECEICDLDQNKNVIIAENACKEKE